MNNKRAETRKERKTKRKRDKNTERQKGKKTNMNWTQQTPKRPPMDGPMNY